MKKLLVICGSTATGKTGLALKLAKKFKAELVSADSRQIYKQMDLVIGKDLDKIKKSEVKVWGLDLVKPDEQFSVAHFVKFSHQAINYIWQQGRLPILVGGTGFWIQTLLEGVDLLHVPPNPELRKKLTGLSIKMLQQRLKKICPERWFKMNPSDQQNPRRLIRAIETAMFKGVVKKSAGLSRICSVLKIGLMADKQELDACIDRRVEQRVRQGAIKETQRLVNQGYSRDLPSMSGLGYRELQLHLENKLPLAEAIKAWQLSEHGYARRQQTWFKKDPAIVWFDINQPELFTNIVKRIKTWYDE
ncbi:tRNA (adenosine(37)-N6)-dimethylallyltransferase MiaA [Patescibacteria group bacterium]|nr:tRNA (adenosine(37)-N6)-dimethylallyltransferase MiaA [Patescibacteria group bacterium]MBU1931423.1 tRNA (adenosine(37)-N6)-dimethylallyltransferase MiaA [Patescibacteria group bacterium]